MLARPTTLSSDLRPARSALESFFESLWLDPWHPLAQRLPARNGRGLVPELDLVETEDAFLLELDLPGVRARDVDLRVDGGWLRIRGEGRETRQEPEGAEFHYKERRFGRYERSVRIPESVDADAISARLVDGVLSVRLPKSEKARERRVEVATS